MKKYEREPKFDAKMKIRLPPGTPPLFMISKRGCDNPYFALSKDARKTICKYGYCGCNGVCRIAG